MLGVGRGGKRDGARCDRPNANVSEPCDAGREDGDESEHVSALLAATRTGGRQLCVCSDSEVAVGLGRRFVGDKQSRGSQCMSYGCGRHATSLSTASTLFPVPGIGTASNGVSISNGRCSRICCCLVGPM